MRVLPDGAITAELCHRRESKLLTSEEIRVLDAILEDAIVKSEEEDGDPVFHEVKADGVNPFADKQTQANVYTRLAKKGLIECTGTENLQDVEILEYVCSWSMFALRQKD